MLHGQQAAGERAQPLHPTGSQTALQHQLRKVPQAPPTCNCLHNQDALAKWPRAHKHKHPAKAGRDRSQGWHAFKQGRTRRSRSAGAGRKQ